VLIDELIMRDIDCLIYEIRMDELSLPLEAYPMSTRSHELRIESLIHRLECTLSREEGGDIGPLREEVDHLVIEDNCSTRL